MERIVLDKRKEVEQLLY